MQEELREDRKAALWACEALEAEMVGLWACVGLVVELEPLRDREVELWDLLSWVEEAQASLVHG